MNADRTDQTRKEDQAALLLRPAEDAEASALGHIDQGAIEDGAGVVVADRMPVHVDAGGEVVGVAEAHDRTPVLDARPGEAVVGEPYRVGGRSGIGGQTG